MKIVTVIGARPQIIKAAAISRAIKTQYENEIQEIIIHTGQHYDDNMSDVFFNELSIPHPDYNLHVGSGTHGVQTARITEGIEEILLKELPDFIMLFGDTNSTLAGAVAASKIHIPIAHVEAGMRSFNKYMPEEINRIVCDHCSTLLFSPTQTGVDNLQREGFALDNEPPFNINNPRVYHCGDVMYDNSLHYATIAETKTRILNKLGLDGKPYILATVHRDTNTDQPKRLKSIFSALMKLSEEYTVVLPLHPRTSKHLKADMKKSELEKLRHSTTIRIINPVPFLEMTALEQHASLVLTDSGGVQKEAYFFKKPCIILRPETEWVEIVKTGNAILADADENRIMEAWEHFKNHPVTDFPEIFGDGHASEFILDHILKVNETY